MPPRINPSHKLVSRGGLTMSKRKTVEEYTAQAIEVHGHLYDYSRINYSNNNTSIEILCKEHGSFWQRPNDHLKGFGCSKCSGKNKKSTEQFIVAANKVHNNRYLYPNAIYTKALASITITCKVHGDFKQKANSHLMGNGCSKCVGLNLSNTEEFIKKASKVHKSKYTYNKVNYVNSKTKVIITCPIHGDFEQSPNDHLKENRGCSGCTEWNCSGFNKSKSAILYYLKITTETNQVLYKVGITNRTVNERFSLIDLKKIEIIKQKEFELGLDAYVMEQSILKRYKKYKYTGPKVLDSGNTELFTVDIREIKD